MKIQITITNQCRNCRDEISVDNLSTLDSVDAAIRYLEAFKEEEGDLDYCAECPDVESDGMDTLEAKYNGFHPLY